MAFEPSSARVAAPRAGVVDPRFTDLMAETGEFHLAGVPFDASVLGRKGAKGGPTGIREAFRFLGTDSPDGRSIEASRIRDHGDVAGLDACGQDILAAHAIVRETVRPLHAADGRTILIGGDHGLTFPHMQALAETVEGKIGIVVIDAHYDLRDYTGQPSSGTPFYRILKELGGRVEGRNIAEMGIRAWANTRVLAERAARHDMSIYSNHQIHADLEGSISSALEAAGDGVDHLWLSIDIDGLDQSIASGCSAPGAGGLSMLQAERIVQAVGADPRCRGMDLLEVAPALDPTGNTCRTAAQLVAEFVAA